ARARTSPPRRSRSRRPRRRRARKTATNSGPEGRVGAPRFPGPRRDPVSDETAARPATKATVSQDERLTLVELAREAVEARARQRERLPLGGRGNTPRLVAPGAAFVTVRE